MAAVVPAPFQTYFRLNDGQALDDNFAFPTVASEDSITAATTHTQAAAYKLTAPLSRVATVAGSGDGVALPPAYVGKSYWVINDAAANAMQVYGNATLADTINGIATATGISQPANTIYLYTCTTAGAWITKQISDVFTNVTVSGTLTVNGAENLNGPLTYAAPGYFGTFLNNGVTGVVTANTAITANSLVIISLNTSSGTVGAIPHLSTFTTSTNFTTVGSAADTSLYNYAIINV